MAHVAIINRVISLPVGRRVTSIRSLSTSYQCFGNRFRRRKNKANDMPQEPRGASYCHLQVVGSGPRHCPPSLFLFSDVVNCRYLINCGEGTQRVMNQHKMKISRLENVFITSLSWKNIGGLVGLTLTLRDICHTKKVNYYGPPGLSEVLSKARMFAILDGIKTTCKTYDELPITNEAFTIQAVPIYGNKGSSSPIAASIGNIIQTMNVEGEQDKSDSVPANKRRKVQGDVKDMTIAYIFKLKDKPGNIMINKAISLGLPPGPLYGELKKGNAVTTEEGKTINPEDVLTPIEKGSHCIVLECPTEDHFESLESNAVFCEYQRDDPDRPAILVVHQTPSHVLKSDRYQTWMNKFGPSADHMIMNDDCNSYCLSKSYILQTKLNMIHPEIFPSLKMNFSIGQEKIHHDGGTKEAECLLKYHMRPLTKWDRTAIPVLPRSAIEAEAIETVGFTDSIQEFRKTLENLQNSKSKDTQTNTELNNVTSTHSERTENEQCGTTISEGETMKETPMSSQNATLQMATCDNVDKKTSFPEIVFLGTGSAMPNNSRNVSAILINISEDTSIIMDCGEGTMGQIYRHYGEDTDDILQKLQCVYVSHLHADHHTGLINILLERQKLAVKLGIELKPVNLILPNRLIGWLKIYDREFESILQNVRITPCKDLLRPTHGNRTDLVQLYDQLNLKMIQTVAVNHFGQPYGVAVTHNNGWKLVYSGDTMPCHGLIDIGQGADVLIHEGTLEDGMEDEALDKRHSTIAQAVAIGNKMNAGFLMLTHFSQRYHKMPIINASESDMKKIGIAYDHMKVSFEDLKVLPELLPVLKCLFADYLAEIEQTSFKRSQRQKSVVSNS